MTFEPGDLIEWLFWPPASSFGKTPAFIGKTPADVAVVSPGISYTFRQGFIAETWIEPLTCEDDATAATTYNARLFVHWPLSI